MAPLRIVESKCHEIDNTVSCTLIDETGAVLSFKGRTEKLDDQGAITLLAVVLMVAAIVGSCLLIYVGARFFTGGKL